MKQTINLSVQLSKLQTQLNEIQEQFSKGNFQVNVSTDSKEKINEVELVEESVKPAKLFSILLRKFNNVLGIKD